MIQLCLALDPPATHCLHPQNVTQSGPVAEACEQWIAQHLSEEDALRDKLDASDTRSHVALKTFQESLERSLWGH